MDLEAIKQGAFRHFEKVLLIGVVAFVILNAMGHMSKEGGTGIVGASGRAAQGGIPSKAITCGYQATVGSYLGAPPISRAPYDIWWPPGVRRLGEIQLQIKEKETATIKVSEDEKIEGKPKKIDIPAAWRDKLEKVTRPNDSLVDITVLESGNEITIAARKEGRWVGYEVQLESGDRVQFVAVVDPAGTVRKEIVLAPLDVSVEEKEFGVVHITFKAPPAKDQEQIENIIRTYHVPSHYIIKRKGPDEEAAIPIGRIAPSGEAKKAEGVPVKKPALPGLPGGPPPPGAPAAPGAPDKDSEVGGVKDGRLTFIDRSVDSEASYSYTIYGVTEVPSEGGTVERKSDETTLGVTTKARFTFFYVGSKLNAATIIVMIGPRSDPEGHQEYTVPVGGRVGELPHIRKPDEPLDSEVPDQRFVTGYVLVDMVSNAYRLVKQTRPTIVRDPVTGNQETKMVDSYWGRFDRYVILRDAKNRLTRVWVSREPAELKKPDVKTKTK